MSYSCKDHGEGILCNGCHHSMLRLTQEAKPERQQLHPFGSNRADRRAAMKRKKPGYSKLEQRAAWNTTKPN